MPEFPKPEEPVEGPECPTRGCGGHMADVDPQETARSDQFVLVRIECPQCRARAWRILRPADPHLLA